MSPRRGWCAGSPLGCVALAVAIAAMACGCGSSSSTSTVDAAPSCEAGSQADSCAVCGDGVATGREDCDGQDLRGKTCADFGFDSGELACLAACVYDLRGCQNVEICDNGKDDDGNGLIDCADPACANSPSCAVCGDGIVTGGETCDDGNHVPGDCCDATCHAEPGCEIEPNDDIAHADSLMLAANGAVQIDGWIRGTDVDFYAIAIPPGNTGNLMAQILGGAFHSACTVDLKASLEVLDASGHVVAVSVDPGDGSCAQVAHAGLPPEAAYVRVQAEDPTATAIFDYQLAIGLVLEPCGDGVVDPGQECDDGNTMSGDGCSSACRLEDHAETEPDDTYDIADGPFTPPFSIAGTITPGPDNAADEDWYAVTLPHSSTLAIEVYAADAPDCSGLSIDDLGLWDIQNGNLTEVLSLSGPTPMDGGCAVGSNGGGSIFGLGPQLPPGTYYVNVLARPAGGKYRLVVLYTSECGNGIVEPGEECDGGAKCSPNCTLLPICGDGVLEPPEQCDDGNNNGTPGDGCSSTCMYEPPACAPGDVCEVEPNDTPMTANGPFDAPVTIHAVLEFFPFSPVSPIDFFAIRLTAAADLRIATSDPMGPPSCAPPLDTAVSLFDGQGNLLQAEGGGDSGNCVLLRRTVDPGTYLVSVSPPSSSGSGPGTGTGPTPMRLAGPSPGMPPPATTPVPLPYLLVVSFDSLCGDGQVTGTETCDDGTPACLDQNCRHQAACGDGILTPPEQCDDGNTAPGDGCSPICTLPRCGDGYLDSGEECDDGSNNGTPGDACSADCMIVPPPTPPPTCGDGVVNQASEQCDDGNTTSGDGCSANCQIEPGNAFEHEPNDDGHVAVNTNDFSAANANGPFSADVIIHGAIDPVGDDDCFAISNPGATPVMVRLETFGPASAGMLAQVGACVGIDTEIHVRDVTGAELAFDDDSGIGSCSMVEVVLAAGETLYAQVTDAGDNSLIPSYLLQVTFE